MEGIKHKDVGSALTSIEFHADDAHELISGTSFPGSPSEKDLFYRSDEHIWYLYDGTSWIEACLTGEIKALVYAGL